MEQVKNEDLDQYLVAYQGDNIYDFDNNILLNWYPRRVMAMLKGHNNDSLLELGLGHGITTNLFSTAFERHLVLDGSSAIISKFRSEYPSFEGEIVETYFEDFNSNETFDVIIMGFILEHVDHPIEILRKYKKHLNPGGRMFIAVPNAEVLNRRVGHEAGLLDDYTELSEHDHMLGHKRYYTVKTLNQNIQSAGFKTLRLEGLYLKPLTTPQMLSLDLTDDLINGFCKVGIDYPELSCGILAEIQVE